jgi:hypothetical protein
MLLVSAARQKGAQNNRQRDEKMKKIIAVAAILAASFIAPTLPSQAASWSDSVRDESNCAVLPMFKRACWEAAREAWHDGPSGVVGAYRDVTSDAADAAEDATDSVNWPKWRWWN